MLEQLHDLAAGADEERDLDGHLDGLVVLHQLDDRAVARYTVLISLLSACGT